MNVLAEDVERFDLRYLDPLTGQWVETLGLDAADRAAQSPAARGRITLVLKPVQEHARRSATSRRS